MTTKPTNNIAIQKAWVVSDIEQAAHKWSRALNIGPFYLAEYTPAVFENIEYRGKPGKLHMKTAIAYSGDIQIELVEPVGIYPCAYFDTIEEGGSGFHHLCYWSDDMDADLEHYQSQGFEIANQGQMTGGGPRFAYIDANEALGCMIELLERRESTESVFAKWRDDSKHWTAGQDSIVRL
jgi:hypothetical protein